MIQCTCQQQILGLEKEGFIPENMSEQNSFDWLALWRVIVSVALVVCIGVEFKRTDDHSEMTSSTIYSKSV